MGYFDDLFDPDPPSRRSAFTLAPAVPQPAPDPFEDLFEPVGPPIKPIAQDATRVAAPAPVAAPAAAPDTFAELFEPDQPIKPTLAPQDVTRAVQGGKPSSLLGDVAQQYRKATAGIQGTLTRLSGEPQPIPGVETIRPRRGNTLTDAIGRLTRAKTPVEEKVRGALSVAAGSGEPLGIVNPPTGFAASVGLRAGKTAEAAKAALTPDAVRAFGRDVKQRLGLDVFDTNLDHQGNIVLNMMAVPKGSRKQGIGTAAIKELTQFADDNGKRVILSAGQRDPSFGTTSQSRLFDFYKRQGFVRNRGRTTDFTISENMYREPRAAPAHRNTNFWMICALSAPANSASSSFWRSILRNLLLTAARTASVTCSCSRPN